MRFSRLLSHARHNAIAYIALFVALGGTAAAASPYIRSGDPAGGDLTGTYPNPSIASGAVTSLKILDGTITAADVASANKDGAASTPSLRTLGSGPQQAMPGNANPSPGGAAGGALTGTYPDPMLAAPEPWTEITPGTGCGPGIPGQFCAAGLADYPGANTVAFFKDPFGIVHLKGTVLNNGASSAFDLFFVPEGYRPAGAGAYAVAKGNNVSIVDVGPNGTVLIPSGIAPGEAVSLDGLNWRAG